MGTPKISDIILFSKVAELKNFTQTADKLDMAKSMVSKRISRLEHELGVRLLNRSTRKMSLTEAGDMLYEYSQRIQNDFEDAVQAITANQANPKGTIKVLAPLSFGNYYLSQLMSDFSQQYPELNVELILNAQYQCPIDMGFDVAITVGDPEDSNLMCKKLGVHHYVVCASPEYFKKHGTPQVINDLEQHNCLIHKHLPDANSWRFRKNNNQIKVPVSGNFMSNSSQSLKHAAINHSGIVMLPDYTLKAELNDGRLVEIFPEFAYDNIGLYALFPYTKHVSPKLRLLLDFLFSKLS